MAIQEWSEEILLVELQDDPQFTDDLTALMDQVEDNPRHVVLNFSGVGFVNSSNIAKLLRVRKTMITCDRKLVLCDVNSQVWGVLMVMGLDRIFECTNDVSTALATLQLGV